jgi:hypothetical protein
VFELGTVMAPSGALLIVDPRFLDLWCHDRLPVMPEGVLSSPEATASANNAVDLEIIGTDAIEVGRALDRSWHPRFLFDMPREAVADARARVAELARARNLDARLEALPRRITHRARIDLALEFGRGAGEVQFQGIWSTVVGSLPARSLRVVGESMPEGHRYEGRLRRVSLQLSDGAVARTERCGYAMVDAARLLLIDIDRLDRWTNDLTLDGLADLVFWGADAVKAARILKAPRLPDDNYGWCNVPIGEVAALGQRLHDLRVSKGLKFAIDERPHSHMHQLMAMARASETQSGVVPLDGATACGFMTTWGDGIFEINRDFDSAGNVTAIRIELGTEERVRLMDQLNLRWNTSALVSRRITDEGMPVRFMYREAPDRDQDSGWRMFSGYEGDGYSDDPKNIAIVPLSHFQESDRRVDALLDEPVGSVFERAPEAEEFARITDWQPTEED